MTFLQAIKLAITALEKQRRPHAFNANLYKSGVITEATKLSQKEYDKYTEAIETLKGGNDEHSKQKTI